MGLTGLPVTLQRGESSSQKFTGLPAYRPDYRSGTKLKQTDYRPSQRTTGHTPEVFKFIPEPHRTTGGCHRTTGEPPEETIEEIYTHRTTGGVDRTTGAGRDSWDFDFNGYCFINSQSTTAKSSF